MDKRNGKKKKKEKKLKIQNHLAGGEKCFFFLSSEGVVFAIGENSMGQCGLGEDLKLAKKPTQIVIPRHNNSSRHESIVAVSASATKRYALFLTDEGLVYSTGVMDSNYNNLGYFLRGGFGKIKSKRRRHRHSYRYITKPTIIKELLKEKIIRIRCNGLSMFMNDKGEVFTAGRNL